MVTSAAIPAVVAGVGAELHHAKWRTHPRKGMAVAACSDQRIDEHGG